jgi:sulfur transfer complex TusBCD TusB component (DsrH family)
MMGKLFVIRKRDVEQLRLTESIEGASILLLQDGVYLAATPIKAKAYALATDAKKRGAKPHEGVTLINYSEIVGLLLEQGHTVVNL